jgi:hypothetical protein
MLGNLLYWLSGYLPVRFINGPGGEAYLERYFVCQLFGVTVYLHRFMASDPGREHHNHPFAWAMSLILSGWYEESRLNGLLEPVSKIVQAPGVNLLGQWTFHRVNMPKGAQTWTLFIHGPWVKTWGFIDSFQCATDPQTLRDNEDTGERVDFLYRVRPESVRALKEQGRKGSGWWRHALKGREHRI